MAAELRISPDLSLPLEAATETFAILAVKRAGKSNAAVVMAEEMYDVGIPWVAIDAKGDWWGVRAAGDGEAAGLSVLVFGGLHGDVPLEPGSGRLVADLVVEQRITCVLDVSEMTKADQRRFLIDFADRLYRRNTEPLHVFCEEADEYIPQRVLGEMAKLVGAFETLVKRGGFRGIGITLITQRSASLNKDVLTQAGTLIAMRTPSPQDRKAVLAWIDYHQAGKEVVDELPLLEDGEAWVFSPQWLRTLQKIRFRRRRTFDSGATPKVGGKPRPPARLADVDLAAIKEQMAETIERAKADDPKELRKQIKQLQQQLGERPAEREVVEIEVPIVPAEVRDAVVAIGQIADRASINLQEAIAKVFGDILEQTVGLVAGGWGIQAERTASVIDAGERFTDRSGRAKRTAPTPPASVARRGDIPMAPRPARTNTVEGVNEPRQRILDAIAWYNSVGVATPRRGHVAFVAGTSPASSGFEKNLGALRTAGLVHYPEPGTVALTPDGAEVARPSVQISTTAELIDALGARLGKPKAAILRALVDVYPEPMDRVELAERVGVSPQSSGFEKNIGSLRGLGFVAYPGPGLVVATDLLFIDGDR
jgi:hypothetical protein